MNSVLKLLEQLREVVATKLEDNTRAILIHPFNYGLIIRLSTLSLASGVEQCRNLVFHIFTWELDDNYKLGIVSTGGSFYTVHLIW
jgi:hypothetical protein